MNKQDRIKQMASLANDKKVKILRSENLLAELKKYAAYPKLNNVFYGLDFGNQSISSLIKVGMNNGVMYFDHA